MPETGNKPQGRSSKRGTAEWRRLLVGAESRWPAFAATLVIIAGQARLASSLQLHPGPLLPSIAALLLVTSIAFYVTPGEPGRVARAVSVSLVLVLVVANVGSLALLIRGVFLGSALTPLELLGSGITLWVVNVLIFAIAYWELDGGGPEARLERKRPYPDLVFPQQQADQTHLTSPDWRPSFGDYLYVALTNGTAFSPTDTMPYTRRSSRWACKACCRSRSPPCSSRVRSTSPGDRGAY
jgi:uncharacterized membrane protein YvlD (DUF360 family)